MSEQLIQQMIVDQNVFELRRSGTGSPTIILDAGLGAGLDTWSTIFDRLAELTTTFCYNRLGVGGSRPVATPLFTHDTRRTSEHMVQELHTLLVQADLRPPYLLMGHSLGGLNMQLFASRYPHEVTALVLLDTGIADIVSLTEQALGHELAQRIWQRGFEGEPEGMRFSDYLESCDQVAQAVMPPVPVKVLSATLPLPAPPESAQIVQAIVRVMQHGHAMLVQRISQGEHIVVEKSSHNIHRERPDIVYQVVRTIVEQR